MPPETKNFDKLIEPVQYLSPTLAVAEGRTDVLVGFAAHCVDAETGAGVFDGADVVGIDGQWGFGVDVGEVPFERVALQISLELEPFADVARLVLIQFGYDLVEVWRVVIGPDVDEATRVLHDHFVGAAGERVRRDLAENVADVTARRYQQVATAHPSLFRKQTLVFNLKTLCIQPSHQSQLCLLVEENTDSL